MFSIGILGFLVWSQWMAFLIGDFEVINFAICWKILVSISTFNSENLIGYVQSAGNLSLLSIIARACEACAVSDQRCDKTEKSPSETTRETTFNYEDFRLISGKSSDDISDDWLTWFIGFSEGDGAILSGSKKNRRLTFVLTQKENAILHHIHETLCIGRVRDYGKFSRFHVDDKKGIFVLTALFNGNLVLKKRNAQLKFWLEKLNIKQKNNIVYPLLNNSWLSGFIDAEGCFNVTLFKRKEMNLGYQVKLRFMIDQKDSLDTMLFIKSQLNLILTNRKLKNEIISTMYRVESNSFIKIPLIIKYLNIFKLKSKKQNSFNKWVTVFNMVNTKKHLTKEGLEQIKILSKQVNIINSITKKIGNKN